MVFADGIAHPLRLRRDRAIGVSMSRGSAVAVAHTIMSAARVLIAMGESEVCWRKSRNVSVGLVGV